MKKRLLITSIVMMLVVAVALSTATYAWFTSNASVTASSITLTADSSGGLALGISWLGGQAGTSITATGPAGTLKPMVPATLTSATTSDVAFSGATTYSDGGTIKFNAPYSPAPTPYYYQNSSNVQIIDLVNLSPSNGIDHVNLTATIAADTENKDASNLVRIGVFTASASNSPFTFQGVIGSSASLPTEWGVVTQGNSVDALTADNAEVATVISVDVGSIAAEAHKYVKLVMWLDGAALTDTQASYDASISLTFTAA